MEVLWLLFFIQKHKFLKKDKKYGIIIVREYVEILKGGIVMDKLERVEKKFDEMGFAMEMMKEVKESNKRKDKIYCTIILSLILVIIILIGLFFWYESQFEVITETEETTQTIEDIDNSNNSNFIQTIN